MLSYGHGERSVSNDMSKTCSLAKAKFDNLAESHDELAFRKGDVLTVVDQMDGLDGWWLCSFRGKQGIVPANRVTLLAGMYYESALRFSASPDSSISDGGSVDYDIPRSDPQNRHLPPLPHQNAPARKNSSGPEGVARELLYDIPKSLEKTRIHADNVAMPASNSMPNIARKIQHVPEQFNDHVGNGNLYDTPNSSGQLLVNSAALMGRRSSGPISPICRSGDSAVDMTSNRSSMMSNTSSPPGSSVCDSEGNVDLYDTPNPLKSLNTVNRRQLLTHTHQKPSNKQQPLSTELAYDVPKALQDSVLDYRDSGIYDNARLSTVHISPCNDSNLYDSPSSIAKPVHTTHPSAEQNKPIYDVLPSQAGRKEKILPKTMSSDSSSNLIANPLSINMNDIEKITLKLCEAIEIVVKLQQHVHTSATRLLSFVHTNWRVKSNLESVLYDLKLACVGLQSTLQEFYDFGIGALANAVDISDKTVMKRLSQTLFSLKSKLDVVNDSMKSLSAIKWHIAKLEQAAAQEAGGDHLMRLMAVAREVGEDVNRVASVIHGNSSLLFIASPDQALESPLPTTNSRSSLEPVQSKCLVREDSIDSYHEYDYCELTDRQDTPTNELINIPPTQSNTFDHDQDCQYLRYYLKHVHSICDTVKIHITRMQDILVSESNQTIVSHSKLLLSTAHKLVYIGDTLCRSVRQASVQTAISDNANSLCNALKDFIMNTKEVALSQPSSRQAALNRLGHSVKAIELHTESFRYVISSQAN
ncbi:breast cancer anti-estrogen resistance protein 1-like isoform X2 [Watersipora subatra]|uniref:breast cancer anti-estrogen resistance protein 1-like isoform X2 n=1 Tax=Watersipora subatra TaxID=2589382 RepID=UPI00355B97AA